MWKKEKLVLGKEPTQKLGMARPREVLLSVEIVVFSLAERWALALSVSARQHGCGMG